MLSSMIWQTRTLPFYAPVPNGWGRNALMAIVFLSVCLSVCQSVPCLIISSERNGIGS